MEVVERAELDVVEVPDAAVRVRLVPDAVELEVREAQARLVCGPRELRLLREADAVRRALDREVADLACVARGLEEERRDRGLAARELDGHLALRLDRDGVVEDLLDVVPDELVDVADLVRVHEARVAHHVAAVREVHREDGAASVAHRGRAVVVELVLRELHVAAEEVLLEPAEERRVARHQVLERAVLRARLDHPDLVSAQDDVGRDFPGPPVHEVAQLARAADDGVPDLPRARRAQGVGPARVAEGRLRTLVGLRKGLGRPGRLEGTRRNPAVHGLERVPGDIGRPANRPVNHLPHFDPPRLHGATIPRTGLNWRPKPGI